MAGSWLWVDSTDPDDVSATWDVVTVPNGDVVKIGEIGTSAGAASLRRFTTAGALVWDMTASSSGAGTSELAGGTMTSDGYLMVVGRASGSGTSVTFGGITVALTYTYCTLVAKIDIATAEAVWLRVDAGSSTVIGSTSACAPTSDGGVIVCGRRPGTISFAGLTNLTGVGHWIAKITTDGVWSWRSGSTNYTSVDNPTDVAADGSDGVWLSGMARGNPGGIGYRVYFGSITVESTLSLFGYLAHADSSGVFDSAVVTTLGGADARACFGVTTHDSSPVQAVRTTAGMSSLRKTTGGTEDWSIGPTGGQSIIYDVQSIGGDVLLCSGWMAGGGASVDFVNTGPVTVATLPATTQAYQYTGFLATVDAAAGQWIAVHSYGGAVLDVASGDVGSSCAASGRVLFAAGPVMPDGELVFGGLAVTLTTMHGYLAAFGSLARHFLRQRQSPRQSIRVGNDLLLRQRQRWT